MTSNLGTFIVTAASDNLSSTHFASEQLVDCIESVTSLHRNVLVAVKRGASGPLKERLESARLGSVEVVEVPDGCMGSLATAAFALSCSNHQIGPVHIAAGDTVFLPELREAFLLNWENDEKARTYTFESSDPRYSYVSVDRIGGRLSFVAEKRRISSSATIGLFSFSDSKVFMDAATWCFVNNARVNAQFYVSTTLNYLVQSGHHVTAISVPPEAIMKAWL